LQILHDAIAEKQSYPESAIALKQSGTVKIGFMLYPDGELKQVSLVKSSGIETIDAAAISAASSITTINHVQQYLQKPTYFTIDVEFR
jgi:TonB family protein